MAKKHADTVDLRSALLKRVKIVKTELDAYTEALKECVNERAHLKQFYMGRIEQAGAELEYLEALLDA